MGIIYKHTCNITDLSYIGSTIFSIDKRLKEHIRSGVRGDGKYFQRALKKYGVNNFSSEILEDIEDTLLNDREIFWIEFYDTFNNGYNLTKGGNFGFVSKDLRIIAENKRQNTNIKKYGGKSPACSKEISEKRKETMSKKNENGLTIFEENGVKISKALKGKVSVLNIKTNMKLVSILSEDYNSCWYLVGVSSKFLRYYEFNNIFYRNLEDVRKVSNHSPIRGSRKTPYIEHKILIDEVRNNFEKYNLFFNNF